MKKFGIIFLATLMVLASCGKKSTHGTKTSDDEVINTQFVNIVESDSIDVDEYASYEDEAEEDNGGEIPIEILSDKDIYFKPDMKLPSNSVVCDMVDLANCYAIMHAAYCDAELGFRMDIVTNDEIKQLKTSIIKDPEARKATREYVEYMVNTLPRKPEQWEEGDSVLWKKVNGAYMKLVNKLCERFALSHYGKFTQEDANEYLDAEQFIPDFYESVCALREEQNEKNEELLLKKIKTASNFDQKCLYTIEYAHQRRFKDGEEKSKYPNSDSMMEELMKSRQYSRFLQDVWRTWRCKKQLMLSPSRDGTILNMEYNDMRYRCLNTIVRRIINNPKDIKAINSFCYLATYNNIIRYGYSKFGNSVWDEYMMLFPEVGK